MRAKTSIGFVYSLGRFWPTTAIQRDWSCGAGVGQ
jgi:hypothetical protein